MHNLISSITISLSVLIVGGLLIFNKNKDNNNTFSAYYNSKGSFAGFIQKKQGLIRACEFSTNGSILSCSMWFNDEKLIQGQNQGINEENI